MWNPGIYLTQNFRKMRRGMHAIAGHCSLPGPAMPCPAMPCLHVPHWFKGLPAHDQGIHWRHELVESSVVTLRQSGVKFIPGPEPMGLPRADSFQWEMSVRHFQRGTTPSHGKCKTLMNHDESWNIWFSLTGCHWNELSHPSINQSTEPSVFAMKPSKLVAMKTDALHTLIAPLPPLHPKPRLRSQNLLMTHEVSLHIISYNFMGNDI